MFHYDGSFNFSAIDNTPAFLQYSFESGSPLATAESSADGWKVFPNPADQSMVIQTPAADSDYEAALYDMTGRIVNQWHGMKGEVRAQLDVSSLPSGLYMLGIVEEYNRSFITVVIQHP
jgi:hypothetical protein